MIKSRSLMFPKNKRECDVIKNKMTSYTQIRTDRSTPHVKNLAFSTGEITGSITINDILTHRIIILTESSSLPKDDKCNGFEIIVYNRGNTTIIVDEHSVDSGKNIRLIYVHSIKKWIC